MEIISNVALISINETLVVQVVSFLFLLFALNRILFRPLQQTMDQRSTYVDTLVRDIVAVEDDMKESTREMENRKMEIRAEALSVNKELERVGSQEATDIVDAAVRKVTTLRDETTETVNRQISEARVHLQSESEVLATQIMEKVLNRRLST
jgi:F-type H+-transporting ATPase subunit b